MTSMNPFQLRIFNSRPTQEGRLFHPQNIGHEEATYQLPTAPRINKSRIDSSFEEIRHELRLVWRMLDSNRNEISLFKQGQKN